MKDMLLRLLNKVKESSKIFAFLAVLVHLTVFFWNIDTSHDWGGDFSLYIKQAEAIKTGQTKELATMNRETMLRSERRIGPDLYPPGYPLLLLPLLLLFGKNFIAFKCLNLLLFLGILYLIPKVLNFWGYRKQSYWLVAYLAALPFFMRFEHEIISDLAAWYFAILALYYYLKSAKSYSWKTALICGLAVSYSLLVKSLAFTLVGAMFASLFIDFLAERRKDILKMAGFLLLGLIMVYLPSKLFYPSVDSSYMEQLVDNTFDRLYNNLVYNFHLPRSLLMDYDLLFYPFAVLFLIGVFRNIANRKFSIALWFFLFHLILLTLWPFHEGPRFMYILIPILILLSFEGWQVLNKLNKGVGMTIALFMLSVMFVNEGRQLAQMKNPYFRPGLNEANDADAKEVWDFINRETTQSDTIIFFKPRVLRLFTGRIGYLHTKKEEAEKLHPKYYIKVKNIGGYEDSTYINRFENNRFIIYEIPSRSR